MCVFGATAKGGFPRLATVRDLYGPDATKRARLWAGVHWALRKETIGERGVKWEKHDEN